MASYMGFDAAAWLEMDDPAVLLADFDMSPNLGRNLGPKANMVLPPSPMPSTTPTALPSDPMFTAPSREYSEYRQETPVVPGAFVNTMSHISEPWVPPTFDTDFSFAASPLDSPTSSAPPPLSKKRVYPGFHSMQHQQQLQQQQHLQLQQRTQQLQQRTQDMHLGTQAHYVQHFPAAVSPSVDEGAPAEPPRTNGSRTKKNEDEMDEDEKLLNSEAGKQLNSKARRQLRNKVSARHFRSRRKEQMQVTEERLRKSVEKGELMGTRILFLEGKVSSLEQENHRLASLVNGPMTGFMNSPEFQSYLRRTQSLFTFTPPQTQASQPDGLSMLAASPPNLQVNAPLVSFSGVDMDSLVNLDDFDDDVDDEVADELPKKRFKSL